MVVAYLDQQQNSPGEQAPQSPKTQTQIVTASATRASYGVPSVILADTTMEVRQPCVHATLQ